MSLYISSNDYSDLAMPRAVLDFSKTTIDGRNILIVEVDIPLIGQKYGLLDKDIYKLFLLNRVDESAFVELNTFPIDVHVLVVKDFNSNKPKSLSELQNIAWARLYDNKNDAADYKA